MKLINTLSHMPFKSGEDLYFCDSPGAAQFDAPVFAHASKVGLFPDTVDFQPWRLARLRDSVVEVLTVEGLSANTPLNVFCNPVVSDTVISFVHANKIYKANLSDSLHLTPYLAKTGIFTGFSLGSKTVSARPACAGSGNILCIEVGDVVSEVVLPLQEVVRIIPHGDGYVITGKYEGQMISILWNSVEDISRITSEGLNVYKCCIDGDYVIHAKKTLGFDSTFVFRTPMDLVPL